MKQGRGNDMIEMVVLGGDPGAGGDARAPGRAVRFWNAKEESRWIERPR